MISVFYLFFNSSPNLSGHRLDVYHTSTHARLKCAALGSLEMQDAKNRHLRTIAQLYQAISSQLRCILTIGKKRVKQQYLPHKALQYGERRPTNGWDMLASLGHPSKFQRVSCLGSVTARHSSSGHQPDFAALNRGRHLYSAGRPLRLALAHILFRI